MRVIERILPCALVGALLVLAGCAATIPEPPKEPIRDQRIVPYSRIGEAALGMTEAQLLQWIGTPSNTYEYGQRDNQYVFAGRGLWVGFSGGKASGITANRGSYRTTDGIGLGSPELEMRVAWGRPTRQRNLGPCGDSQCNTMKVEQVEFCFANGLMATIDAATRRVISVSVYASGCGLP